MSLRPLSVLDQVLTTSGSSAADALARSVELAQCAEDLGYVRYWFAEHHNVASTGCTAPEVLIAHVAALTSRIRVGSGGIMLPNHAPLRIAEAFHTLEALHPGRIDLGIGRAPSDAATALALRAAEPQTLSALVDELFALSAGTIDGESPLAGVHVMPSGVQLPPVWILGSSGWSARMAGALGAGYSFATHFTPESPLPAIRTYRECFRPSKWFAEPHVILAVSVVCAENDQRAEELAATLDLAVVRGAHRQFVPLPSVEEAHAHRYTQDERQLAAEHRRRHIVGSPETVKRRIEAMADENLASEVMVVSIIHGRQERLRSYELLADAFGLCGQQRVLAALGGRA